MNFIIKGSLPTMNEIIDASKSHWTVYRRIKEEHTNLVAWCCKHLPPVKRVNILITWYCKNRRHDPDNVMAGQKFILDGLVTAGVLPNDGWDEIGSIYHSFKIDKKFPRIHVQLIEI